MRLDLYANVVLRRGFHAKDFHILYKSSLTDPLRRLARDSRRGKPSLVYLCLQTMLNMHLPLLYVYLMPSISTRASLNCLLSKIDVSRLPFNSSSSPVWHLRGPTSTHASLSITSLRMSWLVLGYFLIHWMTCRRQRIRPCMRWP